MADKYEVLAALMEAEAKEFGDQMGWHHVSVGVLRDLHDLANGVFTVEEFPEVIYDRLLASVGVKPFDEELEPGAIDPETGRYNPNEA